MIFLNLYKNKYVAVIGLGKTGKATADSLRASGANVSLYDDSSITDPNYSKSDLADFDWENLDSLIVSPGINLLWPTPHPAIQAAYTHSIPIINDIDLFQQHIDQNNICVTGTNGKSTTSALIHHILNYSCKKASLGGNFGSPVLSLNDDDEFYVLELSSYQLESCNILGFNTSILLNITPEHLIRHGGIAGYIAAKQKIFANFQESSSAIIGIDDDHCLRVFDFLKSVKHPNIIPISGNMVPEFGVGWSNDMLFDNRSGSPEMICKKNDLLDGEHNRQNIAATYAACLANNVSKNDFCCGVFSFNGLKHRQETVANVNGVQYINDSKATNADSTEQALKRFDHILWILGGRPKENGISSLMKYSNKIKFALLIGEAAKEWSRLLEENGIKNEITKTLDIAVQRSYEISKIYDAKIVLLSPACASFDQFKNFEERGDLFKTLVHQLDTKDIP